METCIRTDIIAEAGAPLDGPLPVAELRSLSETMTTVMDRVALAVFDRRLDLDDCVVERYAILRPRGGAPSTTVSGDDDGVLFVPLPSMADPDALVRAYVAEFRRVGGRTAPDGPLEIVGLKVRAIRTPDYPDRVRSVRSAGA